MPLQLHVPTHTSSKIVWCLVLLLGLLSATKSEAQDRWAISGRTMGPVPYSVVIADPPDSVSQAEVKTAVAKALEEINQRMSTYIADSDVGRFNATRSTDWLAVDKKTAAVVKRSLELTKQTDGAFDVRVAAAVKRWKSTFSLPAQKETDALAKQIADSQLTARLDPPAIRKSNPNLMIDLSAIAKGYAADQVSVRLVEFSLENFMIEVGGEIVTRGERESGQPWRLGVERPDESVRSIAAKVALSGQAMATSGDYRNYFTHQGSRYSHTIDPVTCRPVKHFLASVTVVAKDCMTADALATAFAVMGADKAHEVAKQNEINIYTIDREGGFDGPLRTKASTTFPLLDEVKLAGKTADSSESNDGSAESIWPTFLAALIVFSIAIAGMAVGAIFANKPVTGSCGGLSAMAGSDGEDASCSVCAKPVTDCVENRPVEPS